MPKLPPRHGSPYEDAEIALVFLVGRSQAAREKLAKLLGRSEGAVDLIWRWIEHAAFPPGADNRIKRQVEAAEKIFGSSNQGKIEIP